MFTQFISNARGSGYSKYDNEIAVIVNKSGITIVGKANLYLTKSEYLAVYYNNTEWALKPTSKNDGGYKLLQWGDTNGARINRWHISCTAFIKSARLVSGAAYIGKLLDGMVVFSNIPSEILGSV